MLPETDEDAVETPEADGAPVENPVEAEARSMGWVPKGEFKGPESQWRDADEFVERGKNVLPIVNSLLKKEREKTSKLEAKYERMQAEWGDKLRRLESMSELAIKRTEDRIRAEYEARKEAAVERGDMDAYRAAEKAEKAALSDLEEKAEERPKGPPPLPPEIQQTLEGWVEEVGYRRWTTGMQAAANERHEELLKEAPGMSVKDNLAKTLEYVQDKYPEKFGKDPTRRSRVEGGSRSGDGGGSSAYGRLPADAKKVCNGDTMGWKLYLKPGESADRDEAKAKERWAAQYWSQPGV